MNKMNNLLVVFNGNEIYPSNINKLYNRRLFFHGICEED